MAGARQALDHAGQQVADEAERISGVLDDLPARCDTTEAAVRALLAAAREDATRLAELRARLLAGMEESTQQVVDGFQGLQGRVQELQERMQARLTEAEAAVQKLREAVEKARDGFGGWHRGVKEQMEKLGAMATEMAEAFVASVGTFTVVAGRNVVDALNTAVKAHNEAHESLRSALTSETANGPEPDETWVTAALAPVRAAVQELALVPPPATDALKADTDAVAQRAEAALSALSGIAGALDRAVPSASSIVGG
jgi:FtsZ-binding cell division protein ZapB